MSWAIEEYAEDAVKAYIASKLTAELLNNYVGWTNEEIKFPCFIVHCGQSSNLDGLAFGGQCNLEIKVAVMSEANAVGAVTARNTNRSYRDAVLTALAMTALQDDINALSPVGVVFSLAHITDMTRSVETDKMVFVSEITVVAIASPKDIP